MSCRILCSLRRFQRDERGDVSPIAMILVTTIAVLGIIVGLGVVRDHVTQEMGDIAVALDNVDQSFSVTVEDGLGATLYTAAYVDPVPTLDDLPGDAPACLDLSSPAIAEGAALPVPAGTIP